MIPSGEDVDRNLTSFPAVVTFDITDDDFALEPMERYTLRLNASDPIIPISQAETEILIVDDDCEKRYNKNLHMCINNLRLHVVFFIGRVSVQKQIFHGACWNS